MQLTLTITLSGDVTPEKLQGLSEALESFSSVTGLKAETKTEVKATPKKSAVTKAPVVEEDEPEEEDEVPAPKGKKFQTKKAPVVEEDEPEEDEPEEEDEPAPSKAQPTLARVKEAAKAKAEAKVGNREKVKAVIKKLGADKIDALSKTKYAEALKQINAIK